MIMKPQILSGRFSIDRLPTGAVGTVLKGNGSNSPVWEAVAWDGTEQTTNTHSL